MASTPPVPVRVSSRPRTRSSGRLRPKELAAIDRALNSDADWAARHLPILRGASHLLRQPDRTLRKTYAALEDRGEWLLETRIALLDEKIAHLAELGELLRRARSRLAALYCPPGSALDRTSNLRRSRACDGHQVRGSPVPGAGR